MYQLFFTPEWFHGLDLIFDGLTLVIALLISGYSWKVYKLSRERKFGYFSLAFVLVAFGLLLKSITHGMLYFTSIRDIAANVLMPIVSGSVSQIQYSDLIYRSSFFLQMASMLSAWLLIFFISQKARNRLKEFYEVVQIALFLYFILLISFVSNFKYFVFYLTSAVILGMIVLNYYKNYLNSNKNNNAWKVMAAFMLILLSNIFFVFVFLFESFYVIGEVLMLLGFLLLLYTYRKIVSR